jgi:4-amino-4-deoxy-L-arabinose transferase-like glycosyltransferase
MTRDAKAPRAEESAPSSSAHRLLLGLVLLLGAWLRIHNFDRPGLWIDEYGTWWVIASESYTGVAARAWEVQGQSPLYYLIVRGFVDLLGLASWALRLPSLLLGILVLWLGYVVTRELFRDRRLALMATAALAIHAPLIRYSQEARPYALALALSLASFALFIRVLRGSGFAGRATCALVTAGTFYAHYLFGFTLLVQAGYAMSQRTTTRRPTILTLAVATLLMAPGGLQLANLFNRRRSLDWAPDPNSLPDSLGSVAEMFIDPWPLGLAALAVVALLAFGARAWRGDPGDRPGLVLGWLLVPFAVFALVPALLDVNLIHRRYLLFSAPAARILVGALLALPRRRPFFDALPLLVFTGATIFWVLLPHHESTGTFAPRKDQHWDTAVNEMLAAYQEGDRVLLSTRFVEMDTVVAGVARESIREFVTWPLLAHLPADVTLPYTPLPYRVSPSTRPVLERILREAFGAERVWVLGAGPSVKTIARLAAEDPRITFARRDRHGSIRLILLTR